MSRVKPVCWSLVAMAAVCTALASSASAAPPDFGRCVKVAKNTGTFATGSCTTTEGLTKNYEWIPGPGPNAGFALSLKPEGFAYIEGKTSKAKITCTGASGSGTITGPTTVGLTLTMTGCETAGVPCNSKGLKEKEWVLSGMTGELGVTKAGETHLKDQIGLTLATGEWAFECGGALVMVKIDGSAIGVIAPTHAMALARKWTFKIASKTRQVPESFEGGIPQMFEATVNGSPEPEGLSVPLVLTSEEKVEINTVF